MNTLSWFLYFADVFSSLGALLAMGSIAMAFVWLILGAILSDSAPGQLPRWWKICWVIPPIMIFVSALIPSKNTMYAIAASELGQQAVESRVGQKALQAIEAWIDQQIAKK